VTSRDVRAPNLSELFAAPTVTTLPSFNNPFPNRRGAGVPEHGRQSRSEAGNRAQHRAGIVLSRPSWLPGLSLSFDYYSIKLSGVVSTLSAQQIVQFCFEGNQAFCGGFVLNSPVQGGNFINVQPFNLASWKTSGFDIEASYQWRKPLGLPGSFTIRALGRMSASSSSMRASPVSPRSTRPAPTRATRPTGRWLAVQTYTNDAFSLTVQERWFSGRRDRQPICGLHHGLPGLDRQPSDDRLQQDEGRLLCRRRRQR
jgi:iron complex outermembrane receptor protein